MTADSLLRTQRSVTLGGDTPDLMSAEGVLRNELVGFSCASGTYSITSRDPNTAIAASRVPARLY
jgi:hypothetical protein